MPEHPSLLENIIYQINGLIIVFIALSLIWGSMELVGLMFKKRKTSPKPLPAAETAVERPSPGIEEHNHIMAVVAAAVHATMEHTPHIIRSVTADQSAADWAREGRRSLLSSHQVR